MPTLEETPTEASESVVQPARMYGRLHDLLMEPRPRPQAPPAKTPRTLPVPIFPQHSIPEGQELPRRSQVLRAARTWGLPYIKGRLASEPFRPLLSYLFTDYKCNLDCHYCWAFDNRVKGMTEDVAMRSIDWLHDNGCRVLALMGGEPLLRPDFIHKVVNYAARRGFFVYLATNGRLMNERVIDRLCDAGIATINLAVDCVDEKPGLPKALTPIRPYFDHLVKVMKRYGTSVFLNINITRISIDDALRLTEIGHENGVATDYHINESPMMEQEDFKHLDRNSTFITPAEYCQVDTLLDTLIAKKRSGYKLVNSPEHLENMKNSMRGKTHAWQCRAGQNSLIIRADGTLAPCFPMYNAYFDWGTIENHRFEARQLDEMKTECNSHCCSTLNYLLGYCYDDARVLKWVLKQARNGFGSVTGGFE